MRIRLALFLTLLTALFAVEAAPAWAGGIEGSVVATVTLEPLALVNANVWRFDSGSNSWLYAASGQTDDAGKYAIPGLAQGRYKLQFSDVLQRYANAYYPGVPYWQFGPEIIVSDTGTETADGKLTLGADVRVQVVTDATGGPVPAYTNAQLVDLTYGSSWGFAGGLTNGVAPFLRIFPGPYRVSAMATAQGRARVALQPNGSDVTDVVPGTETTITIRIRHDPDWYKDVVRLAGPSRYDTALEMAKESYPGWQGVTDVVVASGEDDHLVDALSAAGLCGVYDAPLLLVRTDAALPGSVDAALRAMPNGIRVHIVGGPPAVSVNVENALKAIPTVGLVDRCAGTSRYDTAAQVAWWMKQKAGTPVAAFVANGEDASHFWDALSLSPVARAKHYPILLTRLTSVPTTTSETLDAMGIDGTDRYIAGSALSVGENVATSLGVPTDNRWYGATRYGTAIAIAQNAITHSWLPGAIDGHDYGIASSLPDALATGPMLGKKSGPLFLTNVNAAGINAETAAYLSSNRTQFGVGYVAGSELVIPDTQRTGLMSQMNP